MTARRRFDRATTARALATAAILVALASSALAKASIAAFQSGQRRIILVAGTLELEDGSVFERVAAALADPAGPRPSSERDPVTVTLESEGGSLAAGLIVGASIRNNGFETLVDDGRECASACAYAWLGGTVRHAGPRSRILFHAAFEPGTKAVSSTGNALIGAYMAQLGLNSRAIAWATTPTPAQPMARLSVGVAEAIGVSMEAGAPDDGVAVRAVAAIARVARDARAAAVGACYRALAARPVATEPSLGPLKRCFVMDYAASRAEPEPRRPFFDVREVSARIDARLGGDASYRDPILARWIDEADEISETSPPRGTRPAATTRAAARAAR